MSAIETGPELVNLAELINNQFREGGDAFSARELIREFPRPILVDFNNVLVNNTYPLEANPEASKCLESLRQIGNIFVVTTAENWNGVWKVLDKNGLWERDMVLMTDGTYRFLDSFNQKDWDRKADLVDKYINRLKERGEIVEADDFEMALEGKRIAPIFRKSFDIPLIDDNSMATDDNPGILGIRVEPWEPRMRRNSKKDGGFSLGEAVEIVRKHYQDVDFVQSLKRG